MPESIEEFRVFASSLLEALAKQSRELEHNRAQLKEQAAHIEKLKFELARLRRWRFGNSAESLGAEQIALWSDELDGDIAAAESRLGQVSSSEPARSSTERRAPRREKLPETLPRLEEHYRLESTACADCGGTLEQIGAEVTEQLDLIPAKFFVRRYIRAKYCCRHCQSIHTPELPPQPIDKGMAAPGLLAQVLVSKYQDHQPLYRQEQIYQRMGIELPRSTLAGWVGQLEVLVEPLVKRMKDRLLASEPILHADEIPVPVLEPGNGKTATGYLWAYRSGPWSDTQAVVFDFAMSRGKEAPNRFLDSFCGTLVVDGYAGYADILRKTEVIEAGCWAHARRKLFEVWEATRSPAAKSAIEEIRKLYQIERDLKDLLPQERAHERRRRAAPLLAEFKSWLESTFAHAPPRGALAKAIRYTLNRWRALTRYLEDGLLNIDNNPVENAVRGIALGRNYVRLGIMCSRLLIRPRFLMDLRVISRRMPTVISCA
jgi:transposase